MTKDQFGYWFAGFTDGEGCFNVFKNSYGGYQCRFMIALRADDLPVLQMIRCNLDYGRIEGPFDTSRRTPNGKPQFRFIISTKEGCLSVCQIFSKYPLQSKKKQAFSTWKEAVDHWMTVESGILSCKRVEMRDCMLKLRDLKRFEEGAHP